MRTLLIHLVARSSQVALCQLLLLVHLSLGFIDLTLSNVGFEFYD